MDAPFTPSKSNEIKKIILMAMNGAGVREDRAVLHLAVVAPMLERVLIGESPPGVSQWRAAGVKWGYWRYFEEEMQKKFDECITEMMREYAGTELPFRVNALHALAELRKRAQKISV